VRAMVESPVEAYFAGIRCLNLIRLRNNDEDSQEEDDKLDELDVLWYRMTGEEIKHVELLLGYEPPAGSRRLADVDVFSHEGPPRRFCD